MKAFKKVALLSTLAVASIVGLGACKSNAKLPVSFVAVTSSDYNAQVTFGDYDYKFQGKINQGSSSFKLLGIAVARHATSSGGGQGGFPGGGFPGGGFPGGNSSGPAFEGFGAEEQGQGGQEQQGGFPGGGEQQGGFPGGAEEQGQGGQEQQGGFPGGAEEQGQGGQEQQGGEQGGFPGGFPGGQEQGGQQGGQEQQEAVAPTSLELSLSLTEAFINQSVSATVSALPENASTAVSWTSSDPTIATVNNGTISSLAVGTVNITATSTVNPEISATAALVVKKENLAEHNWSVTGTCVKEKGYGYKLTFKDNGNDIVIHTDFDKTAGRHEFYYNVKIGETEELIKFQAKDPTFKDELVKDYKKWDERDSKYIFCAKATGNNNSVATAYMYLHESDHSVVVNTPSGANRSLKVGLSWEESGEGANKQIIVHDGDQSYTADVSLNEQHPGYRIVYSGSTYYCSLNKDVKWKNLTIADFEGENIHEFTGSYTTEGPDGGTKEVNLNLVEDGSAKLYLGSSTPSFVGTWSKDSANKLTINLDEKVGEFVPGQDGKYNVVVRVTVSSFFGSSTNVIQLTQAK